MTKMMRNMDDKKKFFMVALACVVAGFVYWVLPIDLLPDFISGIGWVDGRLHILIHYVDHDQKGAKLGESAYNVWSCNLVDQAAHVSVGERVLWDEDGDAVRDYVDFVINCKPDDPKLGDYSLNLEYIREFVDGNWEINIPLEEFR